MTANLCPQCGAQLKVGAKFCGACGQAIGGATAPAAQTAGINQPTPKLARSGVFTVGDWQKVADEKVREADMNRRSYPGEHVDAILAEMKRRGLQSGTAAASTPAKKSRVGKLIFAVVIALVVIGGIISLMVFTGNLNLTTNNSTSTFNKPAIVQEHVENKFDLAQKHIDIGWAYVQNRKFSAAINELSEAIELNPSNVAYIYRGIAYTGNHNFSAAEKDFMEAANYHEQEGGQYMAQLMLGELYLKKKDWNKAIAYYTVAINIAPDRSSKGQAYCHRALAYAARGKGNDYVNWQSDKRNAKNCGVDPDEFLRERGY